MRSRVVLMMSIFALFTTGLFAAGDVNGKWTAEMPARNGGEKRVQTFTFKADGDKLTGTIAGPMGAERPVTEGTVKGDQVSFTMEMKAPNGGETRKMTYTGKIAGDEIQFKITGGPRERELTAKRATP